MRINPGPVCVAVFLTLLPVVSLAAPRDVSFSKPANTVEAYDFIEVAATVEHPDAANPFTGAALSGTFQTVDGARSWKVDGFSDSNDGSVFRIRFMPQQPGDYTYNVTYTQGPTSVLPRASSS